MVVVLAACAQVVPRPPGLSAGGGRGRKSLNVYNWSDYIDPTVLADFEKETGIKVNYDVFDSNEVLETKLADRAYRTTTSSCPRPRFCSARSRRACFQKLDKSQLPNLKNLDPD